MRGHRCEAPKPPAWWIGISCNSAFGLSNGSKQDEVYSYLLLVADGCHVGYLQPGQEQSIYRLRRPNLHHPKPARAIGRDVEDCDLGSDFHRTVQLASTDVVVPRAGLPTLRV